MSFLNSFRLASLSIAARSYKNTYNRPSDWRANVVVVVVLAANKQEIKTYYPLYLCGIIITYY